MAQKDHLPVVLVLDDLHWADSGTLDFLRYHAQVNSDLATLVITLSRPLPVTPLADLPHREELQLEALDKSAASQLALELLKKLPEVPAILRELLTRGAEGNPFYMEELVKMLIDGGAIVAGESQWGVHPEKLLAMPVPSTLTGVLQARLDSLRPDERTALQHASVIGALFWDQALVELQPQAAALLPSLVQHGLLLPHSDASLERGREGMRTYAFAHHLLHQVTYETLLKSQRKTLHAKAARWLARQEGGTAGGFLESTALHFLKAEEPAPACDYFTRAAEYAANRYAHDAALAHAQQGLALVQKLELDTMDWHWRLLCVCERAWDLEGKRQEQRETIAAMQHLAHTTQDARQRSEAALRQSNFDLRTGDYAGMEASASTALAYAQASAEPLRVLRCQQRLALATTYLGDPANGHTLATDGLAQARLQGERAMEALFLNALSVIADTQMEVLASLELDRQDLLINRELGNRRNEAIALNNLGNGWLRLGAHAVANTYLQEGLQLVRTVGDRSTEPSLLLNLATLALRDGEDAYALTLAHSALDSASAVGSPERVAMAWCALGQAELALDREDAAHTAFETALNVPNSDPPTRFDALAGLARVALLRKASDALPYVEAIMAHLAVGGDLDGTESASLIQLVCYQVLQDMGDTRAQLLLNQAHQSMVAVLDTLNDTRLRDDFLKNVPGHRGIVAAWNAQS
jgi:tetratricopeptide (TPR) repeat protein